VEIDVVAEAPYLSVVLACYNEAQHLVGSLVEIESALRALRCSWELIFIDDASSDETPRLLREIQAERPEYRVFFHERNVGRGGTVAEGFRLARGEIVGYLDVDVEIAPCYLLKALGALEDGAVDGAVGRRVYKVQASPFSLMRHLAHVLYRTLAHMMLPIPVKDSEAGFKFFRRERILPVLDEVEDTRWFWDTELLVRAAEAGLRIEEFTCLYVRNRAKTSTVRVLADTCAYLRQLGRLRESVSSRRRKRRVVVRSQAVSRDSEPSLPDASRRT